MKKIILTVVLCLGILATAQGVMAAPDYTVMCDASGCTPPSITGFFPSSEIWYPGKTYTKSIKIINISGSTQDVGADAFNIAPAPGNLDQAIHLTITRQDNSTAWTHSLYAFYQNGETTLLNSLANNASETFSFTALMYQSAGNEYQSKQTVFDMSIGLIGEPPSPSPTPTPIPSCSAAKPASPGGFSAQTINNTDVKLTWNSVNDPYTGYRVSWGTNANADSGGGTQSLGKSTQLTISGLDLANKFYFFKVQAINDCSSSDWTGGQTAGNGPQPTGTGTTSSNSPTSSPTSLPSGYEGVAEVLGAATNNLTSTSSSLITQKSNSQGLPVVLGTAIQDCNCIWWQILLGECIVFGLYFFWIAKDIKQKRHIIIEIGGIVLTFIVYRILNKCSSFSYIVFANTPSIFCKYFIVFDILIMFILRLVAIKFVETKKLPPPSEIHPDE